MDDDQLRELEAAMDAEARKEIDTIALLTGQTIALVSLLQGKGILTHEDRIKWEADSEKAKDWMVEILMAKSALESGHEDELARLQSLETFIEHSLLFAEMFKEPLEKTKELEENLLGIRAAIAELGEGDEVG